MTTQTSCNNSFLKDLTTFSHNRTYNNSPWPTSPNLVVIPNFGLPMRNYAIKTRATAGDIKSLQLITAVNTPYLQDEKNTGKIDFEAYDALVNRQINDGADGIIVGDAIGKRPLMNKDEHTELIRHTVNCFGSKIKVIANTGSNSTRDAIGDTEEGFAAGMHAALHTNPINLNTSLAGVKVHFENLLSIGPTIIYNVPSITGQDIPPDVICSIAAPGDHNSNFLGVIECAGNKRIKEYTDKEIVVWSGNDVECHDSRWEYGATGVISVTSNLVPGLMKQLMIDGKNPTLNSKLSPLMEWLYSEPNYIGMITALAQLGVAKPVFRGPYDPFPLEKRRKFVELVNEIGRKNFVGDKDVEVLDDSDFIMVNIF